MDAGTTYLKSGKHDKKEIDKKLEKIENQYQLKDLKLVVDKREEHGLDKVHVHGEINPILDGEVISADIDVASLDKTVVHHPGGNISSADPLTANRKRGSAPGKMGGWKHAQLLNKEHNEWRRGHMVSQAFGGKGTESNMSIISQSVNSRMETGPERYAKQETAKGNTLVYKTTWQNHPDKGEIKNFAQSITVEVTDKNGALPPKSFAFTDLTPPAETADNVVLHLNSLGEGMIKDHFGVELLFARELILAKAGGNYDGIEDISDKMTDYCTLQGYAEDSPKMTKMKAQLKQLNKAMKNSNDKLQF